MPLHSTLAASEIHECKQIKSATTADAGKVITPSSTTSGEGSLRKLNEIDLSYTDKTKNLFGWNDIADSTYTSGAPLAIGASTRTLLPNNGLKAQTDTSRLGAIWDAGGSYFQVDDLNAVYLVRTQFKCTAAAAAGTPYVIKLEVESSSGPTVITTNDHFIKGGSYVNGVSITSLFYVGSLINNTQLKVYLTPDTAVNVYDIGFTIQRTYREK